MAHIRFATYTVTKGTVDEVAENVQRPGAMLDIFRRNDGFIRYGLVDLGDGMMGSLSLWRTHAEADAAVESAASYVKEELSDRLSLNTNVVGELAFWSE